MSGLLSKAKAAAKGQGRKLAAKAVAQLDSSIQQETCSSSKQAVYNTLRSGVQVIQTSLASDRASNSTQAEQPPANSTSAQHSESTAGSAQQQQLQQGAFTSSAVQNSPKQDPATANPTSSSSSTTWAPVAEQPQPAVQAQLQAPVQQVCCVCQDSHYVCNLGKPVDGYLAGPGQHMMELPDGSWLCEFCSVWHCSRCGEMKHHSSPEYAIIASWSRDYTCAQKCTKKKGGPHFIDRQQLYSKAHMGSHVHCKPCRDKMLHPQGPALLDIQKTDERQRERQSTDRARKKTQKAQCVAVGVKLGAIVGQVVLAGLGG